MIWWVLTGSNRRPSVRQTNAQNDDKKWLEPWLITWKWLGDDMDNILGQSFVINKHDEISINN